ncbi:MAG: Gfo/Idh/MocA family oxidoreductase [Methanomassiliicoccales archaeon]|nr:Gfo/Idh/MocA family oxidoreductase [Methanomassiliicoccales archaeon]
MAAKIGVGIVGAGFAGRLHAEAYRRCPSAILIAIASPNPLTLENFQAQFNIPHAYTNYEELLKRKDIELVSISVPTFLHKDVAIAAMQQKKHVVCEKPLALNSAQAEEMLATAKREGVLLMYAEDWIFAPALRKAVEICSEGAIGDVLVVRGKESHSGSHSKYAKRIDYCGGGALIHLGIHPIGFGLYFFEKRPRRVLGVMTPGGNANLLHKDIEGEDWGIGVIEFEDGKICQIEANYITRGGMDDVVEFYGTEGVIKVNLTQGSPLLVFSRVGLKYTVEKAELTTGWSFPAVDEFRSLGYQDEIEHFVQCVLKEKEPQRGVRGIDGMRALEVLEKIYESAKHGKVVHM